MATHEQLIDRIYEHARRAEIFELTNSVPNMAAIMELRAIRLLCVMVPTSLPDAPSATLPKYEEM